VAPHLETGAVGCHYHFTPNNGLLPREVRVELVFASDGVETRQMKQPGTGAGVCECCHGPHARGGLSRDRKERR
jgi:hypothetical protein